MAGTLLVAFVSLKAKQAIHILSKRKAKYKGADRVDTFYPGREIRET